MKLRDIRPNSANPRQIKDESFKKLCKSVKEFPRMLELDPHYCDVIIARWEQLTGKKAIKISNP